VGIMRIIQRTQMPYQKCIFNNIRDGGCRYLEYRKNAQQ
jgi:hypothetical protein